MKRPHPRHPRLAGEGDISYDASAELFMPKRKGGPRQPIGYRRFATAAEKTTRGIIPAAARTLFPVHRHSAVTAHRRVAAERDNNTELGP